MSTENGVGNSSLVAGYVNSTIVAALAELCSIPGVEDAFTEAQLVEYKHVGCWRDDEEDRALNWTTLIVDTLDDCIEKCYDNDFEFAAVINTSRVFRCSCTNRAAAYQVLYGVNLQI